MTTDVDVFESYVPFLKELVVTVNKILDLIQKEGPVYYDKSDLGSINYADLTCVEARLVVNDLNDSYYEVIITEASPDNYLFHKEVIGQLADRFPGNRFNVVTEW